MVQVRMGVVGGEGADVGGSGKGFLTYIGLIKMYSFQLGLGMVYPLVP